MSSGNVKDRRGAVATEPSSRSGEANPHKTVVVAIPRAEGDMASAEPAGSDLARVSLPEGWEITLDIVEGADAGRSFPITRTCSILGRGRVEIPLDDSHVSRRHASLEVYGSTCVLLKDLGSTNGTRVNGHAIVSVEVSDGDTIELGTTRIVVTIGTPPA